MDENDEEVDIKSESERNNDVGITFDDSEDERTLRLQESLILKMSKEMIG